ncbi:ATP-binding protein [Nocardioides sp. Kera G14]|uniref:ATP-binding protein n=1 Tax=Nocardioides sp. Kera G14 TaxID=2884264 RepID=UPI001D10760A|nr:ATP-binding protein [Nocardioides sp. Kera G14]UDY25233.1 ATP-binding protein [Nocardioides sp. Kera G14]
MSSAHYPETPASVGAARAFIARTLVHVPDEIRERALLLTSELATNAIRHAHSPFTVTATMTPDEVHIAVSDTRGGVPVPRRSEATETSGRGLMIVNAFADRWGTDIRHDCTTVWFVLALAPHLM